MNLKIVKLMLIAAALFLIPLEILARGRGGGGGGGGIRGGGMGGGMRMSGGGMGGGGMRMGGSAMRYSGGGMHSYASHGTMGRSTGFGVARSYTGSRITAGAAGVRRVTPVTRTVRTTGLTRTVGGTRVMGTTGSRGVTRVTGVSRIHGVTGAKGIQGVRATGVRRVTPAGIKGHQVRASRLKGAGIAAGAGLAGVAGAAALRGRKGPAHFGAGKLAMGKHGIPYHQLKHWDGGHHGWGHHHGWGGGVFGFGPYLGWGLGWWPLYTPGYCWTGYCYGWRNDWGWGWWGPDVEYYVGGPRKVVIQGRTVYEQPWWTIANNTKENIAATNNDGSDVIEIAPGKTQQLMFYGNSGFVIEFPDGIKQQVETRKHNVEVGYDEQGNLIVITTP